MHDANGGGFVADASGSDFSQQAAAQGSGTNLTVDASVNTDVTPDSYTVSAADVGNIIQISAGAGFTTGWYQIVSIQGGTKWRLDRSPAATGTAGGTYRIGGALASPGVAVLAAEVKGNVVWVRGGTYTIDNNDGPGIPNGILEFSNGAITVHGYGTTRGDITLGSASRPIIEIGADYLTILNFSISASIIRDIIFDGNRATYGSPTCVSTSNPTMFYNCHVKNFETGLLNSNGSIHFCLTENCEYVGCESKIATFSVSRNNTLAHGFTVYGSHGAVSNCISHGNYSGFLCGPSSVTVNQCVSYNNTTNGINSFQAINFVATNCIIYGNGGYGISNTYGASNVFDNAIAVNCAFRNNTSGATLNIPTINNVNPITLTADPFVNAAAGNFALNAVAGGGALLRGLGYGTFPDGLTVGYPDVGVAQSRKAIGKRAGFAGGMVG